MFLCEPMRGGEESCVGLCYCLNTLRYSYINRFNRRYRKKNCKRPTFYFLSSSLGPTPLPPQNFLTSLSKGQCHEIFGFMFFPWISFPQSPEDPIRAVSNFFENCGYIRSSGCSSGAVDHAWGQIFHWVVVTGGAP